MRSVLRFAVAVATVLASIEAANALVRIDVDLSTQTMRVNSGSGDSYEWPISSGRKGHLTPTGWYRPIGLYTMVHSAKYDNAPMPHSIFFLSQYAIHGTTAVGSLGRPASHGCIRLAPGNAAALFAMVKAEGASIRISGRIPSSGVEIARRERARPVALGYAPLPRARSLREWMRDPFAGF
ncbi:MAG TPA: L,D-transpeptidase [Roseiarcus sp.]|nr:L,D-transpeptidase [Roseiarcus sp.]